MISEEAVEAIRDRWERRGIPIIRDVVEREYSDQVRLGPDPYLVDETRWFNAIWTIWDGAGSDSSDYTASVLSIEKGLSERLPSIRDAVQHVSRQAGQIVTRTQRVILDIVARYTAQALEAELALLYQSELAAAVPRIVSQQVVSATAWAQQQTAVLIADRDNRTLVRIWQTVGDDRVRPTHARAHGQRRSLTDPFTVGGAILNYPGDPAGPPEEVFNCRCFVTYEVVQRVPQRVGLGRTPPIRIPRGL